MTSVRESVHNLHDDSVDLKGAVLELTSDFSDYQVHLDYDMGHYVPASVKYCFISIVKEALSNIARHSSHAGYERFHGQRSWRWTKSESGHAAALSDAPAD